MGEGRRPEAVQAASEQLWGHSIDVERDERVAALVEEGTAARSLEAIRGWVTRELKTEPEAELSKSGRKGASRR